MKRNISFHENNSKKKAELGYNSLLITLMSHDVKHHIVGVAHRFLPYAC